MKNQECEYFKGKDPNAVVDRNIDIMYTVSATVTDPQSCPLTNKPRMTPDGFGFITDVGIKSKLRQTVHDFFGCEMRITDGGVLSLKDGEVATSLGINLKEAADAAAAEEGEEGESAEGEVKAVKGKEPKRALKMPAKGGEREEMRHKLLVGLAKRYWDARVFGATLTSPWNSKLPGPVQMQFAMSEDPIEVMFVKITRMCVANEKEKDKNKDSTFGDKPMVRFGLYRTLITVNALQAARLGCCTWGDIDKLVHALKFIWSHTKSATRAGMAFERLDMFVHSDRKGGSVPSERIERAVHVSRNARSESPTSILDFDITVDELPEVEHTCITLVPASAVKAA